MADARDAYLESQVMTATPQKLRLMLLDGALRHLNAATSQLESETPDEAILSASLTKSRAIISELLSTVRNDGGELAGKLVGIYLFLFQSLTEAQLSRRTENLRNIAAVLEVERETWRQVCESFPDAPAAEEREQARPREILSDQPAIAPTFAHQTTNTAPSSLPSPGFSVDA